MAIQVNDRGNTRQLYGTNAMPRIKQVKGKLFF